MFVLMVMEVSPLTRKSLLGFEVYLPCRHAITRVPPLPRYVDLAETTLVGNVRVGRMSVAMYAN